jgi:hypothetical protein
LTFRRGNIVVSNATKKTWISRGFGIGIIQRSFGIANTAVKRNWSETSHLLKRDVSNAAVTFKLVAGKRI